jgi:hypothetical protein
VSVGVADAFDVRQEAAICLRALAEFEQQPTGILESAPMSKWAQSPMSRCHPEVQECGDGRAAPTA